MLGGEPWEVDRLPADRNERRCPQGAKDHRAHEREGMEPRIAASNFAPVLRLFDENRDRPDRLLGDLVMPHSRELGEIARFPDHHLCDGSDGEPADVLSKSGKEGWDNVGER